MDVNINKLIDLLNHYFSEMGLIILKREMKRLDISNLKYIGNYKKVLLIRSLCSNVFSEILSVTKVHVIKSELITIFGLNSQKYTEIFLSLKDSE